jgi:hypothetical protein
VKGGAVSGFVDLIAVELGHDVSPVK